MRKNAQILLLMLALLSQSCALRDKASATLDDVGVVAARVRALSEKIPEMEAALTRKLDAARAELAAKGAPVDGSPAELTEWAKQNPLAAAGSPLAFLLVLFAAWRRARTAQKGLTAAVDAVEALPPEARIAFKAEAARSPHMTASVSALVAAIKNR